MERRRRKKFKMKNILLLLLFLIMISTICYSLFKNNMIIQSNKKNKDENVKIEENNNDIEEVTTYLNQINKDEINFEIDPNLEEKLIEYMDTYFKTMTKLENIDMTYLFDDNAFEESYIHETALSMLVDIRKLEKNDMRINDAKYDIVYKKIEYNNDIVTVSFLENDYLHFNFMKDIQSEVYGVENTIEFKKIADTYKILKVRKVQDFYVMITNEYEVGKSKTEAKTELDKIKNNHINDYKEQLKLLDESKKEYINKDNIPTKSCDNLYDREAALSYAKEYATTKNPEWMNYADIGGNCQNYASQVIYAGGIPMDIRGSYQWKHYSSEVDTSSQRRGRSTSWTGVTYFYEYAKNNEGFGLCSIVDINPFYAEAGDIGQVGYDNNYRHTVVVVGNIKDKDNNVTDLLINSNSVDLVNYPLSGYIYPYKRIIKILGWNNE